jgi:hypothetical protein
VAADPGRTGMGAVDVQSTLPGSVYYASQPSIGTYWAISEFVPSAFAESEAGTAAGNALLAQFGNVAIFNRAPAGRWEYVGEFARGSCSARVPGPVFATWGICNRGWQ